RVPASTSSSTCSMAFSRAREEMIPWTRLAIEHCYLHSDRLQQVVQRLRVVLENPLRFWVCPKCFHHRCPHFSDPGCKLLDLPELQRLHCWICLLESRLSMLKAPGLQRLTGPLVLQNLGELPHFLALDLVVY